jgi:hypothetical protein
MLRSDTMDSFREASVESDGNSIPKEEHAFGELRVESCSREDDADPA